jgi:hypothetical protein
MDPAKHDHIAARAQELWETRGRPEGHDVDLWLEAETVEKRLARGASARPAKVPVATNLDRVFPFVDQFQVRAAQSGRDIRVESTVSGPHVPEHFVVAVDSEHLSIYQVRPATPMARARFDLVEFFHLPVEPVASQAGSAEELLPLQAKQDQQLAAEYAGHLERFLRRHEGATWDYAAGPALHRAVLDRLPDAVQKRLNRALPQELAGRTPAELEAHFTP